MGQVASRRSVIAEVRVLFQISPCEFSGGQSVTANSFLQIPRLFLPLTFHSNLCLHAFLTGKTSGRNLGNAQQIRSFGNRGALNIKYCHWLGKQLISVNIAKCWTLRGE